MQNLLCLVLASLVYCSHSIHLDAKQQTPTRISIHDGPLQSNAAMMFYGIGAISGGGATSKLLQNYPQKQRDEILDYLFLPNFGASLHMLKVEIGGDSQSTEGTEASHMHHSWDENYQRGYEWWLMKEAKKRNPNITLYALPWAFPGWVGNGTLSPYSYPSLTTEYVVKWVLGAKTYHNLTIDYLGIWNERAYDVRYVRVLRAALDNAGLSHVLLVVGDGDWSPADDVLADPLFASATFALGAHYPGTLSSTNARRTGKPLWSSEDFSTFNDDTGSGCWARILNRNYVDGAMTSSIAWNIIASYYDNLPFPRCSLMTANEPWSGHYELPGPLWVTAHTTQFAFPGWYYLPVGAGSGRLAKGGSYVALTDAKSGQLTIIFETMSHDHSQCIRPALPPYTVAAQNVTITLSGAYASITKLYYWRTALSFKQGTASTYFQQMQPVQVKSGTFTLLLGVDVLITLSTVSTATRGQRPQPPPTAPFPLPYSDNFQNLQLGQEPNYLTPQAGYFEATLLPSSASKSSGQAPKLQLCQVVQRITLHWCPIYLSSPYTVMGNWSDITVRADVMIPSVNSTTGIFIAARIDQGGCGAFSAKGLYLWLFPGKNQYSITNDLAQTKKIKGGAFTFTFDQWVTLSLTLKAGNYSAKIANTTIVTSEPLPSDTPKRGFAGLGSENFGLACYANFSIAAAPSRPADEKPLTFLLPSNHQVEEPASMPLFDLGKSRPVANPADHL